MTLLQRRNLNLRPVPSAAAEVPPPPPTWPPPCRGRPRQPRQTPPLRRGRDRLRAERATAYRAGCPHPEAAGAARRFRPKTRPLRRRRGRYRPPRRPPRRDPFRRDHHHRASRPERTTASRAGMPRPEAAWAGHARAVTAAPHRPRCRHRRSRAPRRPPLHRGLRFRPATPHRPIHRRSVPPPQRRRQAPPRPPRRVRRMARLRNVRCFFCSARRLPGSLERRYFRCDRRGCSGSRCAAAAGRLSPGRSAP